MIVVDERQLTTMTELGATRVATVHRVRCADPRLPGDLEFKVPAAGMDAYTREQLLRSLHDAVGLRDQLTRPDLAELDDHAIWPLALVARNGQVMGWVTRLIGGDYCVDALAANQARIRRPLTLELLCASGDQLRTLGVNRGDADHSLVRLALMARLAYAIEIVHRPRGGLRLVYGDLNLRDVAVATKPPRVLLLGGDGVADLNDLTRVQLNAPFFIPPELTAGRQQHQDQLTDIYKLGLCIIRGLSAGRGATQVADPASPLVRQGLLDRDGNSLLKDAIGADRSRRPTAEVIKDYLIGRVLNLADRQEVRSS